MKLLFVFLFFPVLVFAQPITWKGSAVKTGHHSYTLQLQGSIKNGWHVYAEKNEALGLEPMTISFTSPNVKLSGEAIVNASDKTSLADPIFDNQKLLVFQNTIALNGNISIEAIIPPSLTCIITSFASNNEEFLPLQDTVRFELEGGQLVNTSIRIPTIDISQPAAPCGDNQTKEKGWLAIFLLGLAGGLFALITPCVFPMIPVTVSFFMHRSGSRKMAVRNGVLYGFFILLIYLLCSLPFHLVSGIDKNIFNTISTNAWVNVAFFTIFISFALSFFGLFEISLPGGIATKADAKKGLGSVSGIFFMALTLTIVSFSCTGVILGGLLANVTASGAWALTAGMGGFGFALALPFVLFAIFPNWLKKLPKSGSWLDTVKKSLAFIELALALKFLSNADLVEHWGILKREVFIGIWLAISIGLALYLLGAFKKKEIVGLQNADHIVKTKRTLSPVRITLGLITLLFAFYLIPGLTQSEWANLKLLSGFPPPLSYSVYGKKNVHGKGLEPDVINDYSKALALSKQTGKPLLIDFTGWACVNCRRMEEQVWTKPEIQNLIRDKYILVSLYVDDRKKLPLPEQLPYELRDGSTKHVETVGDKWALFQSENFLQVTQPLYVILNPDEKLMNHPVGYTPDAKEYGKWLQCGLNGVNGNKAQAMGMK